jgi:hypothetical protein
MTDAPRWIVWLDDGQTMDSAHASWDEVPDRIVVLKVQYPDKKWMFFGDTAYGRPDTIRLGADIPDEDFRRILAEAQTYQFPD